MGSLPFFSFGTVTNQAGETLIENLPISVWPAAGHLVTASGMSYDHQGECPLGAYEGLDAGNTRITVSGVTYMIVEREKQQFLPHVSLRLRRVTSRG